MGAGRCWKGWSSCLREAKCTRFWLGICTTPQTTIKIRKLILSTLVKAPGGMSLTISRIFGSPLDSVSTMHNENERNDSTLTIFQWLHWSTRGSRCNAEARGGINKMAGQQNEGQGPSKVAMVLPDVSKAVPRRERLQVPSDVRWSPTTNAALCSRPEPIYGRILAGIWEGFHAADGPHLQVPESFGQHSLLWLHLKSTPHSYEFNDLGYTQQLCPIPGQNQSVYDWQDT